MKRRLLYLCLLSAALGALTLPAHASKDEVQFGSAIHVPRDASIHDAVCFFCDVDADGVVEGDIVVFFGDVHVGNAANHDVVNFFGNIKADDNAHIGQNVVSMFGSVRLGEDVAIGKDLVAMFGSIRASDSVSVGGDRVVEPAWLFWGPLMVIALVVILVVREVRNHRRRVFMRYPIPPRP
jgi:predicted acyltransferase (DUF342 family)